MEKRAKLVSLFKTVNQFLARYCLVTMQLETLGDSVQSSINHADRIGLDRSTSEHFG